ncbi:MAG: DedA family protein [Desulfatiglandaceae bacterium]|jgi:membrane-associated protein
MDHFLLFLEQHRHIAYLILLGGAYVETVFPFSLFVYGELFFLAGPILAGMGILNIWVVTILFYTGGILGDTTSYVLGRRYGEAFFVHFSRRPLLGRVFTEKNYLRGENFFKRRGEWSVFLARLSGPFSWITPVLAGIFHMKYKRFAIFNTPGVLLGIGEFILVGYLFGRHYERVMRLAERYVIIAVCLGVVLVVLYRFFHRRGIRNNSE